MARKIDEATVQSAENGNAAAFDAAFPLPEVQSFTFPTKREGGGRAPSDKYRNNPWVPRIQESWDAVNAGGEPGRVFSTSAEQAEHWLPYMRHAARTVNCGLRLMFDWGQGAKSDLGIVSEGEINPKTGKPFRVVTPLSQAVGEGTPVQVMYAAKRPSKTLNRAEKAHMATLDGIEDYDAYLAWQIANPDEASAAKALNSDIRLPDERA